MPRSVMVVKFYAFSRYQDLHGHNWSEEIKNKSTRNVIGYRGVDDKLLNSGRQLGKLECNPCVGPVNFLFVLGE